MKHAQAEAQAAVSGGNASDAVVERYVDAVSRYFSGFEREARVHLRDLDKRLEGLNQVVFNLTAERGVAVKRIEATQSVLAEVKALEASAK